MNYIFKRHKGEKRLNYQGHIYKILDETQDDWLCRRIGTTYMFYSRLSLSYSRRKNTWSLCHLSKQHHTVLTTNKFFGNG